MAENLVEGGRHMSATAKPVEGSLEWDDLDKTKLIACMPLFGLAVRVPVYPPQLIKTRIQTGLIAEQSLLTAARHIVRTEGLSGLWRGFGVSLFGLATGPVYITALESSKKALRALNATHRVVPDDSAAIAMAAGAIGSIAGQTVAVPMDVVSQRLQVAAVASTANAAGAPAAAPAASPSALSLLRELGPRGLYRGFGVSLAQYVPSSALTWGGFDAVSRPLRTLAAEGAQRWGWRPSLADLAACGASGGVAGAVTAVVTCPLDVVRTRLQTLPAAQAHGGAVSVVAGIWAARGPAGFYAGLGARIATLSPLMMAIMSGYEALKRTCVKPKQ
ncbi:hypothetical protein KFE25_011855 [Diacronema lutheri]|uniref:Uncharacterized protein n=2 Tax=Diacronema lutheri TaxID=2081491 RepID=A0A8J5XAA6_DIALT|nr:hypothetical protein KFE25_011855 [Diacronema lutheri]